jgi:ribosome-binding factor A
VGRLRVLAQQGGFVLKHRNRRPKGSADYVDPEFAEALSGGTPDRLSSGRQAERKARQFCRQVQQALNLALADRHIDDALNDLFVEDVSPAPDCGHLLVYVVIPTDRPVTEALSALRRDGPRLRSEVATAITRKRAPELSFVPAFPDGGEDE